MKKVVLSILVLGMSLTACKKNKSQEAADSTSTVDTMLVKQEKSTNDSKTSEAMNTDSSVFFKGVGTEPFWSIEIADNMIKFTSLTEAHKEFTVPGVEPIRAADANVKLYKAEVESGSMNIQIAQGACSDNMSDNEFGYKVKVEIKKGNETDFTIYEGCGNYITDYRLNDLWVLEKLGEEEVTVDMFTKELPNMEINTKDNKFFGYAGCNNMRGSIFFEKGLLRFTQVISTKKACMGENKEDEFLKALQSSVEYRIEDNRLYLYNDNGMQLVFKKID